MPDTLEKKRLRNMVAQRIKHTRQKKGMSQHALADALECTQSMICQYETATADISLETVIKLCGALGCSVDYLLGLDNKRSGDTTPRGRLFTAFERLSSDNQKFILAMLEGAEGHLT